MPRSLALAPLLAFALACGGANPGDSCSATGFLCLDGQNAMECRSGIWNKLPCRGDNGCKRDGDVIRCDMSKDQAGDACASTAENKGLCTSDQASVLTCRDGVLVHTSDCKTCAVSGDQVVCQP